MGLDPVGYVGFSVVNYTKHRLRLVHSQAYLPRLSQLNPKNPFQTSFPPRPVLASIFIHLSFSHRFLRHVPSLPPALLSSFLLPSGLGNRMPAFQHGATPLIPAVCVPLRLQALQSGACPLRTTRLLHACVFITNIYSSRFEKQKTETHRGQAANIEPSKTKASSRTTILKSANNWTKLKFKYISNV